MTNGQMIFMLTSADLKEFALTVVEETLKGKEMKDKLHTPEDFAKLHGVDVSTLWRWRKAGILKATTIGGRVYYKESDLKKEVG